MRKHEVFEKGTTRHTESVSMTPPKFYRQERDWTCALACIRTMLSGVGGSVPAEADIVSSCSLQPGPHFSKELKETGLLKDYDVLYGCDYKNITFDDVLDRMKEGYYVMLESMVNYAHWMVLLGFYALGDAEENRLLFFEPYYNEVRLMRADEFVGMWIDGNYEHSRVKQDFIAIRKAK
ncbi:MAG: hypothetical protein E7223_00235 [Clostridiales bacterium]|nr:hypothetical protein [Clostridiales bacterium]